MSGCSSQGAGVKKEASQTKKLEAGRGQQEVVESNKNRAEGTKCPWGEERKRAKMKNFLCMN